MEEQKRHKAKLRSGELASTRKLLLANSRKDDGQQLENVFSHSGRSQMVLSSVI